MINVIVSPSCQSCRRAIKFFKDNNIPVKIVSLTDGITPKLVNSLLAASGRGTEEIISTRSKFIQRLKKPIDDMSVSDLRDLIVKHPSILRRPIIYQVHNGSGRSRLIIGYKSNDIEIFLRDREDENAYYLANPALYGEQVAPTAGAVSAEAAPEAAEDRPIILSE